MREYNGHAWSKYRVHEAKDKPTGPHFAAVVFETRDESSPPYDAKDMWTSYKVPEIHYFAFPDRELLATWVGEATAAKKNFFFFHVTKLGEATVKVSVDLGVG